MTPDDILERMRSPVPRRQRNNDDAAGGHGVGNPFDDSAWITQLGELRPAAVLVPLIRRSAGMTVLLTRRTDHLGRHAGQISFPGGRIDDGDESPLHTALRETEEEIGLHRGHIEIIGELDDYVVGTGFLVTPYVGLVDPPFELTPDAGEVAEIFEVPLEFLTDPANHGRGLRESRGMQRSFYFIDYGDYHIWGATAGMIRNLTERLGRL